MYTILKQLELIHRIDNLIRIQATGSAETLAEKLGISKTKIYRIINVMKQLGAPVEYNFRVQSFVYKSSVGFTVGFYEATIYKNKELRSL